MDKPKATDTVKSIDHKIHQEMQMPHSFSKELPMNRNGSGTGWLPDETPIYAHMFNEKSWHLMYHGNLFLRHNWQNFNNDYRRGGHEFDAPNWGMLMAQRMVGKRGLLLLRGMVSLDRLTMGGDGYPLIFQSGESWDGVPLIDRQHPHDIFSEFAVGYTHSLNKAMDIGGYLGYPGEPALGPTAFMHRISAMHNPDAPLGHHWQDATHIAFGVATGGLRYKWGKLEGSVFTGREPDENRFGWDKPRFDSYSYRLTVNPHKTLSLQFSQGFLESPEVLEPGEDVVRTTASVAHSIELNPTSHIASTLVWGLNKTDSSRHEHSLLAESDVSFNKWVVYSRLEYVQKSAEELSLEASFGEEVFAIGSITLGGSYRVWQYLKSDLRIGGQATLDVIENSLDPLYGSSPLSAEIYLQVSPALLPGKGGH